MGLFGIISTCFSLRAAWFSFFVMPIQIMFIKPRRERETVVNCLLWRALKYKSLWAASLCPLPSRLLLLTCHAKEGHNEESGVAEHGCLTKKTLAAVLASSTSLTRFRSIAVWRMASRLPFPGCGGGCAAPTNESVGRENYGRRVGA